ncbi:hypothetical protein C8J56DRAFT_1041887 [Mycena floridula]|nr:hypothetical protein C8J56DRAFT_1041887 [Mycena floridula]
MVNLKFCYLTISGDEFVAVEPLRLTHVIELHIHVLTPSWDQCIRVRIQYFSQSTLYLRPSSTISTSIDDLAHLRWCYINSERPPAADTRSRPNPWTLGDPADNFTDGVVERLRSRDSSAMIVPVLKIAHPSRSVTL